MIKKNVYKKYMLMAIVKKSIDNNLKNKGGGRKTFLKRCLEYICNCFHNSLLYIIYMYINNFQYFQFHSFIFFF